MSRGPPRNTLFVAGFPPSMRARDLGYEFERCGKIIRCDIPALRSPASTPYAFIEYEDARDAEEAHQKMHGLRFGSYTVTVQFAKKAPSTSWKFGGAEPPRGGGRRDREPRRREDRGYERRGDDRGPLPPPTGPAGGGGRDRRDERRDDFDPRERDSSSRGAAIGPRDDYRDGRDRERERDGDQRRRSMSPGRKTGDEIRDDRPI